ncbi:unnamed protein product [Chondrus crispus]|uniref:Ppx/GppA phosphatase N-terminal domain-containing protein n=1 Tax=Chondrus crispus TaxID=2769 RepID=R7QM05_CHOCR|nr:unnamed protein product [Chondrus crispus]CDF38818.1 unnamed protein product [Chondrus crispus]|eukprot:XP_005718723.1 unnamed protein product [Chondrus crispus]
MSVVRAAFDLGSSHHKLVVALTSPNAAPTILLSTSIRVALADALSDTRHLPPAALRASRLAFHRLHALALTYRPSACTAVATAVFRTARNGHLYLTSLPLPVHILDPETEGALAFASAMLAYSPCAFRHDVVVWDSGGASTQWAMQGDAAFHVRAIALGSSSVRAVYRRDRSVCVLKEYIARLAGSPGEVLASRLERGAVVLGIGSDASMFALAASRKGGVFSQADVWQAVDEIQSRGEEMEEITVLPKLVLLAELMVRYRIPRVRYVKGNGSCVGLLASAEERFWGKWSQDLGSAHTSEAPLIKPDVNSSLLHARPRYSSELSAVSTFQT